MSQETEPDQDDRPKVLIVDDTPANLVAMRRLLRDVDAQLIEACSGNEALAACLDHEFALILLDVQMPDMDGFEVAALLLEEERTRQMPIIFVTAAVALADDLSRLKGYSRGAVDYITKPVNDDILISKVRVFIDLYNSRRGLKAALAELAERNEQLEREVTRRRKLEELARHQAGHDPLTGLPNRLLFMDRLRTAAGHTDRRRDQNALLYIDLDGFKPINDKHGHPLGDATLKIVAQRLQESIRQADSCARLGGDEFAVIMTGAQQGAAAAMAQKLCDVLRQPYTVDGPSGEPVKLGIGASIGVALFPQEQDEDDERLTASERLDRLILAADEAMYEAKNRGRNQFVISQP